MTVLLIILVAGATASAVALLMSSRPELALRRGHGATEADRGGAAHSDPATRGWWLHRYRWVLAAACGVGVWVFLGGGAGLMGGAVTVPLAASMIARAEPEHLRQRRLAIRSDLPILVRLIASGVRAGMAPAQASAAAATALPGVAGRELWAAVAAVQVGSDPADVWHRLARTSGFAPLGRAFARAHESGASVVTVIDRLADEMVGQARAEVEDRARRVGVRAAAPLGLCLLPAFLVLGIVPVVAGLIGSLGL